jgi:hypothetical protein
VKDRRLADQWTSLDRPVLIAAVRRFDEDDPMVSVGETDATGLTEGHVVSAGRHLSRAGYVDAMGNLGVEVLGAAITGGPPL